MNQRNPAILKSARGQVCTLALPGICRSRTDTVVWCHSPYIEDGKGTGSRHMTPWVPTAAWTVTTHSMAAGRPT